MRINQSSNFINEVWLLHLSVLKGYNLFRKAEYYRLFFMNGFIHVGNFLHYLFTYANEWTNLCKWVDPVTTQFDPVSEALCVRMKTRELNMVWRNNEQLTRWFVWLEHFKLLKSSALGPNMQPVKIASQRTPDCLRVRGKHCSSHGVWYRSTERSIHGGFSLSAAGFSAWRVSNLLVWMFAWYGYFNAAMMWIHVLFY